MTDTEVVLQDCPFCGLTPSMYDGDTVHHPEANSNCPLVGDLIDLEAWNTRTPPPADSGVVERVALAIKDTFVENHYGVVASQEWWREAARTAIAALPRTSDGGVVEALRVARPHVEAVSLGDGTAAQMVRAEADLAVIDAALAKVSPQ